MRTITHIIHTVASVIPTSDGKTIDPLSLRRPRHTKVASAGRAVAMYLARQYGHGLQEIADQFESKSHSTVSYAIRKVEACQRSDPLIRDILLQAKAALKGS